MNQSPAAHEKYQFKPYKGSSHSWALNILSKEQTNSTVLDIGAGSGAIGKELKDRKFENLYAIEVDNKSKDHISGIYREISDNMESVPLKSYDIILMLDVIEHVPDPAVFFSQAMALLKPGGKALVSLPNVAHWSVRLPLLFGYFDYRSRGILDKTHVTFFTRNSARELIQSDSSIKIVEIAPSIEPLEFILPKFIYDNPLFGAISSARIAVAKLLPGFFAYQNLFLIQKPK